MRSSIGLDVPVEHRDVRAHAQAVRRRDESRGSDRRRTCRRRSSGARARRIFRRRRPGSESSPAVLQFLQDLLVGPAVQIREEGDLDGGEALQMDVRADPLEAAQQLRVVLERQIGMQPVDDVDFGQRLAGALAQLVPGLFERHRVRARDRPAAGARTSRTGSWRRRRWSPRA